MSSQHDIGFDAFGRPIAIGDEARDRQRAIVEHPNAKPLLVVASLDDELGIRTYGPPSLHMADILDQVAREYRRAVMAALRTAS